jgi:hypothetical protein
MVADFPRMSYSRRYQGEEMEKRSIAERIT